MVVRTNTQKESAVESSESPGRSYWLRKRTIAYYYSTGLESPLAVVTKSSTVYETDSKKRNKSSEASTKATKRAITTSKEVASKKSRKETTVVQTEGEISSPSETLEESSASEAQSTTEQEVSSTGSMEVETTSVKVTSSDDSQSEKTETIVMEDGETSSKTILFADPGTASTSTETTTIITNVEVGSKGLGADTETHEEVMTTTSKTRMRGSRKVGPKTVTKISTLESVEELPEDQHDEKEGEAISAVETEEVMTARSEEQGTTSESLLSTGKKSTNKSKTVKTTTVKTSKMKTTSSNVSMSHTTVVTKSSSSTRNINSEGSLGQVYSMSLRRMGDGKRRVYTWNT
ncbi:mucin-22-like [Branchiostoma floridae]|uniref:Mucin-22-like n=1 Tax=Branchiostoma floridae TaxID=7739 RepID=A0A9J7N838_BRAFL|nr:mucin-22-like [Branchiostoma floridae]